MLRARQGSACACNTQRTTGNARTNAASRIADRSARRLRVVEGREAQCHISERGDALPVAGRARVERHPGRHGPRRRVLKTGTSIAVGSAQGSTADRTGTDKTHVEFRSPDSAKRTKTSNPIGLANSHTSQDRNEAGQGSAAPHLPVISGSGEGRANVSSAALARVHRLGRHVARTRGLRGDGKRGAATRHAVLHCSERNTQHTTPRDA